jgi:D-amino-acid dehydrogenase
MKVAVLGAGIIGISTAYFLARAGAKVIVFEREPGIATQCSYANGAQLSYSHSDPWATYTNVWKAIKWLGHKDAPLLFRPSLDLDAYTWIARFLRNCSHDKVTRNTKAILSLSFYSRKVLHDLLSTEKIEFDYSNHGILHIFKHKGELTRCEKLFKSLNKIEPKLEFERLSAENCSKHDPALEHLMHHRSGGILCAADELGDAYKFSHSLEKICQKLGVEFRYNTEVLGMHHSNSSRINSIILDNEVVDVDAAVVCMGVYGGLFLKRYGINLPIYPMKGYSISVPTNDNYTCPKISITDQQRKIVFSRIGNVFRIAGTAEFAGYNHEVLDERIEPLFKFAKRYFPNAGDYQIMQSWSCLRPQMPHSYPCISKARFNNLYINIGHSSLGWTQAAGSAKAICDLMMRKKPELDIEPYKYQALTQ